MEYLTLGRTGLMVSRTAFELKQLQNKNEVDAYSLLLQKAYEEGINFFAVHADHTFSLEALGYTFSKYRSNLRYCLFSNAVSGEELTADIDRALDALQCDYIEIVSICCQEVLPSPGSHDGLYDAFVKARKKGNVNHIALKTVFLNEARAAAISGLYEIVSYNFSAASSDEDESIAVLCDNMGTGFTALEPAGIDNLINIPLAFGYLNQFENVVSLWNLTTEEKQTQILHFAENPPVLDDTFKEELAAFRS
ncbi:MAG TPA: hypothetical protein VFC68_03975 [Treponemataceae bacterium]|nr:hypothetical protein [Treponemataceae bacterium]